MTRNPPFGRLTIPLLAFILLGTVMAGCNGDDEPSGPESAVTPVVTTSATTTATDTSAAPASSALPALTVDDLIAVGQQVFPRHESGVYSVCGLGGDTQACPYTDRLRARLAGAGATLCRCQNPSMTMAMSAEVTDFGGVLYVAMYDGSQSYMLTVLDQDGTLLIDDQVCHGGGPETSIYSTVAPCR